MAALLGERFAPITSMIGLLHAPLADVVPFMKRWREGLYNRVTITPLDGALAECLPRLEPLVSGARPRELLIEVADGWTAYFDCGARGTDASPVVGHVTRNLPCAGVALTAVPSGPTRYGAVQFSLFSPLRTDRMNVVRTIELIQDGKRWTFEAHGMVLPFEETSAYGQRLKRDRFTTEMLERYCRELGVDAFNADAYGPTALLFESSVELPPNPKIMSLSEAQRWNGIVPG